MKYIFPKRFFWGAGNAAHHVEGNMNNDWSEWEIKKSTYLAKNAEKLFKEQTLVIGEFDREVWNKNKDQAEDPLNYISGQAADHYNLYEKDFDLAKRMHHNAHRFSIEWSRIEPREGEYDEKEIEHYRKIILSLKQKEIEPFVTLFHFTLPKWFSKKGGFEKEENVKHFIDFVERVVSEYKDLVKYWIIMNEPNVWTVSSYIAGVFPPNKKEFRFATSKVLPNLITAQKRAYNKIKEIDSDCMAGYATQQLAFKLIYNPFFLRPLIKYIKNLYQYRFNDGVKNHCDFIGMNYYSLIHLTKSKFKKVFNTIVRGKMDSEEENSSDEDLEIKTKVRSEEIWGITDLCWYIYPKGIYENLMDLHKRYGKPIIITENGCADKEDKFRERFIKEMLKNVHRAISEGVDVFGYLHWSLTDNIEWDKGFWPKFGLVEVDFKTQKRKIKKSAEAYAKICEENGFEE